jgi:transposase-like protein
VKPTLAVASSVIVEQDEIRRLKRENERLRMERDILKNHRGLAFRLLP